MVRRHLGRLREGTLELWFEGTSTCYGSPAEDGLNALVRVLDRRFFAKVLTGGSLGAAEAYLDGWWESPDLVALVRLLARNRESLDALDGGVARALAMPARLAHLLRANTRSGSRRNIREHYDLSNAFFQEFLDASMTYSAAWFARPEQSLEAAQAAKIDRLARKLQLSPGDHLLEIGTGWGSLALQVAREYGCRVTTTTISREQYELARDRVRAAGLANQIRVLFEDYRDLRGMFSRIVSVEMVEAVGLERLPHFFEVVANRLASNGLAAIQSITIAERFYEAARRSVDFIQRYIFPGGAIPSVTALLQAATATGRLIPLQLEELGLDYAETLRRWRERFESRFERIRKLGFDERFRRMWRYYLAYCEGGFRERSLGNVQILLAGTSFRGRVWRLELPEAVS